MTHASYHKILGKAPAGLPLLSQERLDKQASWWLAFLLKLSCLNMSYASDRKRRHSDRGGIGHNRPFILHAQGFAQSTNDGFAGESVITLDER